MITGPDGLINAMGNNSSRLILDKFSIANTAVGQYHSLWRASGQPGTGVLPTTAVVTDNTTLGCFGFKQQIDPSTSYLGILEVISPFAAVTFEIHDRLVHMGGLNGTLNTSQAVNLDLSVLNTSNMTARIGDSNYSDIQWWLEWYADTGGTGVNITVNVTYNDGTTGNLTLVALAATRRASFLQPLNYLIPADAGKFIRGVNNITLSATTGTAGNFGVTATRYRGGMFLPIANVRLTQNWANLGLPEIKNSACLFPIVITNSTSTGIIKATGKILHG